MPRGLRVSRLGSAGSLKVDYYCCAVVVVVVIVVVIIVIILIRDWGRRAL